MEILGLPKCLNNRVLHQNVNISWHKSPSDNCLRWRRVTLNVPRVYVPLSHPPGALVNPLEVKGNSTPCVDNR